MLANRGLSLWSTIPRYYNKPSLGFGLRAVIAGTEGRAISKSSEKKKVGLRGEAI